MITLILLFALPLIIAILFLAWRIVRELSKSGMRLESVKKALSVPGEDAGKWKKDRKGCLMVIFGGFFFFTGYWLALFSLFSSAFLLFFIGVAILVIGMVITLRPILSS